MTIAVDQALHRHLEKLRRSENPRYRAAAEAELRALGSRQTDIVPGREQRPSAWAHIDMAHLLAAAGNRVTQRRDSTLESGHQPVHESSSGRCLVAWPDQGRWYCRACGERGNAVALVASLNGWDRHRAYVWLAGQYGLPAKRNRQRRGRVVARVEVRS